MEEKGWRGNRKDKRRRWFENYDKREDEEEYKGKKERQNKIIKKGKEDGMHKDRETNKLPDNRK